jgi:uncharacterized protein
LRASSEGKQVEKEEAIQILRKAGCSREVIEHCLTVHDIAVELAEKLRSLGQDVDLDKLKAGALLHDIGRARTHGVRHGVEGGKILRSFGLGEFSRFAECHLGAGIPAKEARKLGLPSRDFIPKTLEEKIVVYADKLTGGRKRIPFERTLRDFKRLLGPWHPAIGRLRKLHGEFQKLLGVPNKDARKQVA